MSNKKKNNAMPEIILIVLFVAVIAVMAIAIYYKLQSKQTEQADSKKVEKEVDADKEETDTKSDTDETTDETKDEDTAAEATTEEKKSWIEKKHIMNPTMTDNTIVLPKADLSVFDQDKSQELHLAEDDEAQGPWEQVTLHLDSVPGSINKTSPGDPSKTEQMTSTYMVLVDIDSEEIIAERDSGKVVSPASMTKILTVITARDFIDETKLNDTFTITDEIISYVGKTGSSAVGFKPGDQVCVKDLLYGTIVCSGADAALGLAEYCAGSQEAFVELMNKKVEYLGLSDTAHFTNVVGTYNEDLHCTMKDMAIILSMAIQDDLLKDVLSKRKYTTQIKYPDDDLPDGIEISNWFLRRIEDKEFNGEVIGAKTGFVNESMFCAASYYKSNNGKRYICVTGNSYSSWRAIYDHVGVYRSFTE